MSRGKIRLCPCESFVLANGRDAGIWQQPYSESVWAESRVSVSYLFTWWLGAEGFR